MAEYNYEEFLDSVEKPARYIGGEVNSIVKEITPDMLKFAICFPDIYEIGMSHLGIKILYHILNKQPDVSCQRCFSPWMDAEAVLREKKIPLTSLENKMALSEFDIIGFSLQYDLCYTNVLNILDLSGIPVYSKDRDSNHPVVIAGGPCAYNPEPMVEFIDAFVVGEAEEVVLEIIQKFRDTSFKNNRNKDLILKALAQIPGVYVPKFYSLESSGQIVRRYIEDFSKVDVPTALPIPFINIVHDRIAIEIMRGCPNNCYFCQAGFTSRPVRTRTADQVLELAKLSYQNTGLEKIAFCSLSSANYPQLKELIFRMHDFCKDKGIGVSLPSLRIDKEFTEVLSLISSMKKTGLTFAPEAGTDRMRKLINKNLDMDRLKEAVIEAYRLGWQKIKLYFMIGLPGETELDLEGIVSLADEFSLLRKQVSRRRGQINVSISNFIPKPHTPFQWFGMDTRESLLKKQQFIYNKMKPLKHLNVSFHDIKMGFLESYLSRGDRTMHSIIYKAFSLGARFDAWSSEFNYNIWQEAFKEHPINPEQYVCCKKEISSDLPWSFIRCRENTKAFDDIVNQLTLL